MNTKDTNKFNEPLKFIGKQPLDIEVKCNTSEEQRRLTRFVELCVEINKRIISNGK